MANNQYVNKVQFGNTTIMDISDTNAEAGDVLEGALFYAKSGAPTTGTLGDATQSTHGLMSAADKTKLDGMSGIAFQEIEITIDDTDWSATSPYTYTWTSSAITPTCKISLFFKTNPRTVFSGDISYDKVTGGIEFTATQAPSDTINLIVQIFDSDITYMADQSMVSTAVTEWLDENITGEGTAVDATLSVSGLAADAKVVGDTLNFSKVRLPSKNLNVTPYTTTTINGVTFTVNDDNSLDVTGSPTGNVFWPAVAEEQYKWPISAGTYCLSGGIAAWISISIMIYTNKTDTTPLTSVTCGPNDGQIQQVVIENDAWAAIRVVIDARQSTTNITIYPQLELGTTATSYVSPWGEYEYHSKLDTIEEDIDNLEDNITELNTSISNFSNTVERIEKLEIDDMGKTIITDKEFLGIVDTFQTIYTLDLKKNATYNFTITMSSVSGNIYLYLLDSSNNYIQSNGSSAMVSTNSTSATFSKLITSDYVGAKLALKTSNYCKIASIQISTDIGVQPQMNTINQKMENINTDIVSLQKSMLDTTSTVYLKNKFIPQNSDFTTIYNLDMYPGIMYYFDITISESLGNNYAYVYLLDENNNYIGANGSITGFTGSITNREFAASISGPYQSVRLAIKNANNDITITFLNIYFASSSGMLKFVPPYYSTDSYIQNKTSHIYNLLQKSNCDSFIFLTDAHISLNALHSPKLIEYISQQLPIKYLFDGGDNSDSGSLWWAQQLRKSFNGECHFVMGNHEWFGHQDGRGPLYFIYDSINNNQIGNNDRHYYYFDDKQTKTRYIVLSAFDKPTSSESGATEGYEAEQITWLTQEALNTPANWSIFIFSHAFYYGEFTNHTWYLLSHAEPVIEAIDNYQGPGKIICLFQGHLHADNILTTPGGIPIIASTSDKYEHWYSNNTDMEEFLDDRVQGTITEQAFDVIIHDKDSKTITCVRIGGYATFDGSAVAGLDANNDRVVTYT